MRALTLTWRKLAYNTFRTGTSKLRSIGHTAFSDKYLFYTNVSISVTLSGVGDFLEQHYELYTKESDKYDIKRTMHMASSGASVGVLCHHWYKVLDRFIVGRTWKNVTKKLVLDQVIFSPIMILTFFGSLALFEEKPLENFRNEVKDKFETLYRAEWYIWPPAQLFNFFFLPTKYRVLYDNTISLGFDVYCSQVKHGNKSAKTTSDDSHYKTVESAKLTLS